MTRTLVRELRNMPLGIYLLALITVLGLAVGVYRLYAGLSPTTNLNDAYPWGLWIGFDLFMVAFSGGAFTLAAIVYVLQMHEFHPAIRPTVLTGLVGYSSVLVILVMDLGRWDRFYHFLIYPNLNSALFEVSWCILLYTIVLVSEFSPVFLERFGLKRALAIVKKLTLPLVIIGVTLSTLHQSSLGTLFVVMSQRLHPLWHSPVIPFFFFVSSVAAGLAMVIGGATVSKWVFKRTLPRQLVGELAWFLPWVLGFYLIVKLGELIAVNEFGLLLTGDYYSLLFWAELIIGVIIPMVMFSFKEVRNSRVWALVGSALILAGIFLNRFNATWFALKPVEGYSYTPHWMEIAIQVGVLAGAVLVYTLVGRYFPLFEGTIHPDEETDAVGLPTPVFPGGK